MHLAEPPIAPWQASIDLGFERREDSTILSRRRHSGPLRIQKPLYPEGRGICHGIVLHPPAGIAGGDQLRIGLDVGEGAQALLTTPGAGKWYCSASPLSEQTVSLKVGGGGTAEWMPQECIVFRGAQARMRTTVDLDEGACYLGIETICFGRRASGESFDQGSLALATEIYLGGVPIWHERGRITGGSPLLHSPVGLAGYSVCSTVLAAGRAVPPEALSACRSVSPVENSARCGVTAMPQLFVGRYLGHSAEAARLWFIELWRHLRPVFIGREMSIPRIWNT